MDSYSVEVQISKQEDGLWRAMVPAMPGCWVDGPKLDDVLRDIQEVAALSIDYHLEMGDLPEAVTSTAVEGMALRLPVVLSEYSIRRFPAKKPGRRRGVTSVSKR
jgi:predicted RNase H-like HicB family nuclease